MLETSFNGKSWDPNKRVYVWALVAQTVKNLPAVQETQVQSLGREDPLEGKMATLQYSSLENPMDRGA